MLAFAAHHLFPTARITAADLDPVAVVVARDNARLNRIAEGRGPGAIAFCTAGGVDHPRIRARAPYDLVFANILAGPLVALAPSLSSVVAPGGHLVLAGLLAPQAAQVLRSYRAQGFRVAHRQHGAEWPVLVLCKAAPPRRPTRHRHRASRAQGWEIDTL